MSIMEKLIEAGIKPEEISSHESDLYVKKNQISEKVLADYEFKQNVSTFISQIDGQPWYEVPFAYEPFWEKKLKQS